MPAAAVVSCGRRLTTRSCNVLPQVAAVPMTYKTQQQERMIFHDLPDGVLEIQFQGDWLISCGIPQTSALLSCLTARPGLKKIKFDVSRLEKWDSGLVSFLFELMKESGQKSIAVDSQGLPQAVQKLLSLASKKPQMSESLLRRQEPFLERIGAKVLCVRDGIFSLFDFLGSIVIAFGRLLKGKAFFRWDDFVLILQKSGAGALSLVSLISLLVGVILAFVGAIQLKVFGAQIYIADIVGIAMVRVMGAVMTGVLMSGRTGASFAAELGIMQVNEEIDALKTIGISPVEFLVMPRVLALIIMMPLLTIYADFMGILGGFIVSAGMLGINPVEYITHTQTAVKLSYFWVGLIHSVVFAVIIAVCGCLRGMKCERSAVSVGEATTSAVVTSITYIVIATAIITFVCQVVGV